MKPASRTEEQIAQLRPMSEPANKFQFGNQTITTRVWMMVPKRVTAAQPLVDVTAAMGEKAATRGISLKVVADPFGEVEI